MYLPALLFLPLLLLVKYASALPQKNQQPLSPNSIVAAISSLRVQKPIPTAILLAGVLPPGYRKHDNAADGVEDYADLGGEKPVVRVRKGVWWTLGWSGRRSRKEDVQDSRCQEGQNERIEDAGFEL